MKRCPLEEEFFVTAVKLTLEHRRVCTALDNQLYSGISLTASVTSGISTQKWPAISLLQ